MLHDQHAHRHDPHHDDRPKILDARQLQAQHLLATDRQLVAVVIQVGGEEKREEQLREMRAPYCSEPITGSIGDSSNTKPITMLTYENRLSTR